MESKVMCHRGYQGSLNVSIEDGVLHGKILNINDLVTYEGETPKELESAFIEAVDSYLEFCLQEGLTAEKPLSGTFNIRIGSELHKKCSMEANRLGVTLNEFVKSSIENYLKPTPLEIHHHYHQENESQRGWAEIMQPKHADARPRLKAVK